MHHSRFAKLIRPLHKTLARHTSNLRHALAPVEEALARPRTRSWSLRLEQLINSFTLLEKILFSALVSILVISSGVLAAALGSAVTVEAPSRSGSLTEGIVGSPRFVNPLLAESDADRDLSALVYAGLLKRRSDGRLTYELAKNVEVNESGTSYIITLRDDAVFHDGEAVTARDVAYTIRQAKNPQHRSQIQGDWTGVNVDVQDTHTVTLSLDEPYAPFLQNLTLGILPEHIWKPLSASQFPSSPHNDAKPIGAGPYQVTEFDRDNESALATYKLSSFSEYTLGEPYIKQLTIRSYANERDLADAVQQGNVDNAAGLDPAVAGEIADQGHTVRTAYLPRIFAVFLNHNQKDAFTSQTVRTALATAIDKQTLIDATLRGYGTSIYSPIPAGLAPHDKSAVPPAATSTPTERINTASSTLAEAGWLLNEEGVRTQDGAELSFTLTTSDASELASAARLLRDQWGDLGVEVNIEVFSSSNLNRDVIRPRTYDALLFGEIIGWNRDFYPFWHSSQQNDPGLNVAQYANTDVDTLLEEFREAQSPTKRNELLREFEETVISEHPAIFLYTPEYLYVLPERVRNVDLKPVTTAHERFGSIHKWYLETERVFRVFTDSEVSRTEETVF